jgi:hypothetical protein
MNATPRPPDDLTEHVAALREQGATPAEVTAWSPIVAGLAHDWPEHAITPVDTQRLLSALASQAPRRSAVRQAVRARYAQWQGSLAWLCDTALAQVNIMRLSFWAASGLVALLCIYLELASWDNNSAFLLRALAPLLAYIGISSAFRGMGLRTLEYEVACPPSPTQIALARMVVVLGYDVVLGLALSLAGWFRSLSGGPSGLAITLYWLTPLLLVTGLALTLSLRLPVSLSAGIAYGCWLAALGLLYLINENAPHTSASAILTIPIAAEIVIGLTGLALLIIAISRFSISVSRLMAPVSRA